jgi:hypothetical protein
MKKGILLVAALLCGPPALGKPVTIKHDSKALEFSYSWPSEAAAIPALDRRFRTEMSKAYRNALSGAREDQKIYRQQGRDGIGDLYSMTWTTAGETARLLSLQNEFSTFTGGAHPNTSYGALLWDRKLNRETAMDRLFGRPADFVAVSRATYCNGLDAERSKRREGEKLDLAEFNACPKYSELAISPVDKNRNGRFDAIALVASPYTAGPYVEGEYDVLVPVTGKLIAALKPAYRSSFEPQWQ